MTRPASLLERARAAITPEVAAAYERDGAVCLRQLLTPAEVALLTRGIDANLAQPSPRAIVASRPDDPGRFVEDFCNWQHSADYRSFIFDSPLAEAAGLLMHSNTVRLYHDHMLTKEPGTRAPTPWHQDQPKLITTDKTLRKIFLTRLPGRSLYGLGNAEILGRSEEES